MAIRRRCSDTGSAGSSISVKIGGMRTWMFELAAVAGLLVTVALLRGGWIELLGATAVTLSFAHAQVSDRLAEAEAERRAYVRGIADSIAVDCHRWSTRYLVAKECCWLVYFLALGAWSALAGVGLFLVYPLWRRWWRARRPLGRAAELPAPCDICGQRGLHTRLCVPPIAER